MVEWAPGFHDRLHTGHEWEAYVAKHLRHHGLRVEHQQERDARNRAEVIAIAKRDKDLVVRQGDMERVLEIKSSSRAFNASPGSFPFPTANVMRVDAWKAKEPKPTAVVLVSQPTGAMLVVPGSTRPLWTMETTTDYERGYSYEVFRVARHELRTWGHLVGWLLDREPVS